MKDGWSKKKVLLRLSSMTFRKEQLQSKFEMICKHTVDSKTYKNKLFEKLSMVKIRACLTGLIKCVRTFSNIRYSTVCNFVDRFAMRLGNGLKCVK